MKSESVTLWYGENVKEYALHRDGRKTLRRTFLRTGSQQNTLGGEKVIRGRLD